MRTRLSHSLPYAGGEGLSTPKTYPAPMDIRLLAAGCVLSLVVASTANALRLLTLGGAAAAVAVGTVVFGFGGWRHAGLLVLFFATSSALTRWQAQRKPHPEHIKGRNGGQVLANGTVAALLAVWAGVSPTPWVHAAFAGAIAASTADTWATEVGLLSKAPPRLITTRVLRTRAEVPPGTSGGVTWLGTIAAGVGAAVIAWFSMAWLGTQPAAIWLAGFIGMTVDSILGATVEGRVRWMTNDGVNLIATATGAVLAAVF